MQQPHVQWRRLAFETAAGLRRRAQGCIADSVASRVRAAADDQSRQDGRANNCWLSGHRSSLMLCANAIGTLMSL
jgi:hypothetical protein